MARDVRAVIDELNLTRAAIVGWSDGATIGWFLAMELPEQVADEFIERVHAEYLARSVPKCGN